VGSTFVSKAVVRDEDAQLMLAFRAGDGGAFDALFRRWAGRVLRYVGRLVRDPAVAEELVQEVFLRVHRARERYRADARFSTWLFTIATNVARNELRRPQQRARERSLDPGDGGAPLELSAPGSGADAVAHARRVGAALEAELAALPGRQREALWLVAVEGLSYAEVASALETSEPSVKALVHRARSTLAERMGPERTES
jgi:RNA polymerase sigma-70 factor (ECF subfamily)